MVNYSIYKCNRTVSMLCELHGNRYDKYRVLFTAVRCGHCVTTMYILLYTVSTVCNVRSHNVYATVT